MFLTHLHYLWRKNSPLRFQFQSLHCWAYWLQPLLSKQLHPWRASLPFLMKKCDRHSFGCQHLSNFLITKFCSLFKKSHPCSWAPTAPTAAPNVTPQIHQPRRCKTQAEAQVFAAPLFFNSFFSFTPISSSGNLTSQLLIPEESSSRFPKKIPCATSSSIWLRSENGFSTQPHLIVVEDWAHFLSTSVTFKHKRRLIPYISNWTTVSYSCPKKSEATHTCNKWIKEECHTGLASNSAIHGNVTCPSAEEDYNPASQGSYW